MVKMLNLGCGSRYHPDWINVDFNPASQQVIQHDLSQPLFFDSDSFDMVYHSHILEHFNREQGLQFLEECYRVCKKSGIIRVAVPDLEVIVRYYLHYLEKAIEGKAGAAIRYDWMMLELFDQAVRTKTGGEMLPFLTEQSHPPELTEFIKSRVGNYDKEHNKKELYSISRIMNYVIKPAKIYDIIKSHTVKILMAVCLGKKGREFGQETLFRLQGEVHRWMYDRYSLGRALINAGFSEITICSPNESRLEGWKSYGLEIDSCGLVYKPDSLICEAIK